VKRARAEEKRTGGDKGPFWSSPPGAMNQETGRKGFDSECPVRDCYKLVRTLVDMIKNEWKNMNGSVPSRLVHNYSMRGEKEGSPTNTT
jgi:hypothetical protein